MAPDAPLPEVAPSRVPLMQPDPASHWANFNDSYWLEEHADFLWFFLGQCFPEEHSTKAIEDGVGWGVNLLIHDFAERFRPPERRHRT